ncbi:MAG TPA: hypothetical protein VNJ54_12105 [Plantibacter sp.]|uniref:hypothetical protein n=1 Tax=unclassified Plantibacter TaxID=2624265 RepID=UPI002B743164|nr:hypothetical protein [Plantibacter sp.]
MSTAPRTSLSAHTAIAPGAQPAQRLPAYLRPPQLSVAEFTAARLDGEVFAFEDGFCSVDEPDTARLRAEVLASIPALDQATVAELSAAWIHGAVLIAPREHTGYVSSAKRSAVSSRLRIRQVVLRADDTERSGGLRVTTPTRTVADLARRTGDDAAPAPAAIRNYFLLGLTSPSEVIAWVRAERRVLGRARIERVVATATDVALPGLEHSPSELASWSLPISRR